MITYKCLNKHLQREGNKEVKESNDKQHAVSTHWENKIVMMLRRLSGVKSER
jgi:hypothetical protein